MHQSSNTAADTTVSLSRFSSEVSRPYRIRAKQAAAHLSIALSHFYALIAEGHLPKPQKLGRMSFWIPSELEAAFDRYMAERQRAA